MAETTFPPALPAKLLRETHPQYDADRVADAAALYAGGERFAGRLDRFLIRRQAEESRAIPHAQQMYEHRRKWAAYVNRTGGLIDWIAASAIPDGLAVEVDGGDAEYWRLLSRDADGLGASLSQLARRPLTDYQVHGRAYLRIHAPETLAVPDDEPTRAYRLRAVSPEIVDDWEFAAADREDLDWVRLHALSAVRPAPLTPARDSREEWWFVTADAVARYAIPPMESGAGAEARLVRVEDHDYGGLPILPMRAPRQVYVMDRVRELAVALFNAEAGLSYSTYQQAYAQPVVHTRRHLSEIVAGEHAVLRLDPGEDEAFEYVTPDASGFEAQFRNVERLKTAYYEVLQALAKETADIPQAGRLSGAAITEMRGPVHALMVAMATPALETVRRACERIARLRGEPGEVRLTGIGPAEATEDEMRERVTGTPAPEDGNQEEQNGEVHAEQ